MKHTLTAIATFATLATFATFAIASEGDGQGEQGYCPRCCRGEGVELTLCMNTDKPLKSGQCELKATLPTDEACRTAAIDWLALYNTRPRKTDWVAYCTAADGIVTPAP